MGPPLSCCAEDHYSMATFRKLSTSTKGTNIHAGSSKLRARVLVAQST